MLLAVAAAVVEPRTEVVVFADGGHLHVTVNGSSLRAPVPLTSLDAIQIRAAGSIDPPGGRRLTLDQDGHRVLDLRLPRRFPVPSIPGWQPVGDWWVDELAPEGVVWRADTDVRGPFTLRVELTGRFLRFVSVDLLGETDASVRLRRGLINHDLFVTLGDGPPPAATSIDPAPMVSLRGLAATLLRGAAAAAALVAGVLALGSLRPWRWRPTGPTGRQAILLAVALGLVAVLVSGWVAVDVLARLPHVPDGVTALLQARWLLGGHLAPPAPPLVDHLDIPFTYVRGGRWLTHYPVGWPMLLSVGELLDAAWAVPVALGGATVLLLFLLGRELYGVGPALVAGLLVTLSPQARLMAASHLSHAGAAPLLLALLLLVVLAARRRSAALAVAAGVLLGLGLTVRPLSAAAVAVPALLWTISSTPARDPTSRRLALAGAAGAAAGLLPLLVHNLVVTGNPLRLPYALTGAAMAGAHHLVPGLRHLDVQLASAVPSLFGWGWPLPWTWLTMSLPLAFAWVPFLLRRHRPADVLVAGTVMSVGLAHLLARAHGLHGYGPRYLFVSMVLLALLTARGMEELARGARRPTGDPDGGASPLVVAVLAILVLSPAATLPGRLELYRGYNHVDGRLDRQLGRPGASRRLVLFTEEDWRPWAEAARLLPGDPRHADVVFVRAGARPEEVLAAYGRPEVLTWTGDRLVPLPERPGDGAPAPGQP